MQAGRVDLHHPAVGRAPGTASRGIAFSLPHPPLGHPLGVGSQGQLYYQTKRDGQVLAFDPYPHQNGNLDSAG